MNKTRDRPVCKDKNVHYEDIALQTKGAFFVHF